MRQFIYVAAVCCFSAYGLAAEPVAKNGQADEHKAVWAQIHRDWDFRYSKLDAIRLVFEGSCIVRKGMWHLDDGRFFPPNDYRSPVLFDSTMDFVANRMRQLSRFDIVNNSSRLVSPMWVTETSLFCSDGQVWWKSLRPQDPKFQGGTCEMGYDAMTAGCEKTLPQLSSSVHGLFFRCTHAASVNHTLEVKPWNLTAKIWEIEETNHGRIVRFSPTDERMAPGNEIVIDLGRQSAVIGRTRTLLNGRRSTRRTDEIEYTKIGDLWVSTSWIHTKYIDGNEALQDRMKIVKFDPEPSLSDEMFRFSPTPGMKVRDLDSRETYTIVPAFK